MVVKHTPAAGSCLNPLTLWLQKMFMGREFVVKHTPTAGSCLLSVTHSPPAPLDTWPQKMFMGREFVVKHIRNKHGHVVEAERERLQEEAFWENFRWVIFAGRTFACDWSVWEDFG